MSYLVITPTIKKEFCNHKYQTRFLHGKATKVCIKCYLTKKPKFKNEKLTKYFGPASKRSTSTLAAVAAFVDEYKLATNWDVIEYQDWRLPATGDPHCWCGMFMRLACLNATEHERLGKGNRIYLRQFQRSCYRGKCKICYLKWIARQANNATRRVEKYSKDTGKKPIHLILIAPPSQHELPVKLLRQRMSRILEIAEFKGASVIFHPFRFDHNIRRWYAFPHFHLIGFGDKEKIKKSFGKYGWFVKNEGERNSVFQTFCYLLSHAGIRKGSQTTTWFGCLSYSKMPSVKEPKNNKCPVCGGDFEEVYYFEVFHPVVPPDRPYEGLVDAEGWYPVGTEPTSIPTDFDYAPTRELNEILKGLAMAT